MERGIYFLKDGLTPYADSVSPEHEQEWLSFTQGGSDNTSADQKYFEQISFLLDSTLPAPLYICGAVESTFDLAFHLHQRGAFCDFSSVLAASQKKGRGQLRRHWHSPEGNIYGTIRLPKEYPFNTDAASPILGAIIARSLGKQGFCVKTKWPNDIIQFENGEAYKVAGILLEERANVLMAGIGINICHAPEVLREGASFCASTLKYKMEGKNLKFLESLKSNLQDENVQNTTKFLFSNSLWSIWLRLVKDIFLCYTKELRMSEGTSTLWHNMVKSNMAFSGMQVTVTQALFDDNNHDDCFTGKLLGIGNRGELLVQDALGTRSIVGGSLSLMKV